MSKELALAEIRTMATSVTKSGMFGLKNPEQTFTLMMIAQAEGIAPIQAMQKYSIINGMPSLKSHEIQARFQKSGGKLKWTEKTKNRAVCELEHPAYIGTYESEYTIEDAKLAGLANKDNWKKMPKQMCMARAISQGVRAVYPECLNNMYSVEEAQDIPPQEVEEVEIIDNDAELKVSKIELSNILTKTYNFTGKDIKDFAEHYELGNDLEALKELVSNKELLEIKINEFENIGE